MHLEVQDSGSRITDLKLNYFFLAIDEKVKVLQPFFSQLTSSSHVTLCFINLENTQVAPTLALGSD